LAFPLQREILVHTSLVGSAFHFVRVSQKDFLRAWVNRKPAGLAISPWFVSPLSRDRYLWDPDQEIPRHRHGWS
jgi:hypothetical protein